MLDHVNNALQLKATVKRDCQQRDGKMESQGDVDHFEIIFRWAIALLTSVEKPQEPSATKRRRAMPMHFSDYILMESGGERPGCLQSQEMLQLHNGAF